MTANNTPPATPSAEPAHALSASQLPRQYTGPTLKLPVFGLIPLLPSEILSDLRIKRNPPLWAQFFKYGVCGVVATLVLALVWVIARVYYPEYLADSLTAEALKRNSTYIMLIAFVLANLVAYFTNRIFVFTPGRHSFIREIGLFFIISALSFSAGNYAKNWFIDYGLNKDIAATSFAISSALVNFIARKYLVFSNAPAPADSSVASSI